MLTARGQEVDKVVGLELGADDYVTQALLDPRTARSREGRSATGKDAPERAGPLYSFPAMSIVNLRSYQVLRGW